MSAEKDPNKVFDSYVKELDALPPYVSSQVMAYYNQSRFIDSVTSDMTTERFAKLENSRKAVVLKSFQEILLPEGDRRAVSALKQLRRYQRWRWLMPL